MPDENDTVFSLPSIDEDPDTELGVLLMGMGPERLLAGLGIASSTLTGAAAGAVAGAPVGDPVGDPADSADGPGIDPTTTTLLVDQLRHAARPDLTMAAAFTAGAARWRSARPYLEAADPDPGIRSAALRRLWSAARTAVGNARLELRRAERVYLAACWLRRVEIDLAIDRATEDDGGIPELAP